MIRTHANNNNRGTCKRDVKREMTISMSICWLLAFDAAINTSCSLFSFDASVNNTASSSPSCPGALPVT